MKRGSRRKNSARSTVSARSFAASGMGLCRSSVKIVSAAGNFEDWVKGAAADQGRRAPVTYTAPQPTKEAAPAADVQAASPKPRFRQPTAGSAAARRIDHGACRAQPQPTAKKPDEQNAYACGARAVTVEPKACRAAGRKRPPRTASPSRPAASPKAAPADDDADAPSEKEQDEE